MRAGLPPSPPHPTQSLRSPLSLSPSGFTRPTRVFLISCQSGSRGAHPKAWPPRARRLRASSPALPGRRCPPYSQAHRPGPSVCPAGPLRPAPRARPCRSAPSRPSRQLRPGPPVAPTQPKASSPRRPPPRRDRGPPWPFPPVLHSSLPRLLDPLRPPFPARGPSSAQANPSGLRRSLLCPSVGRSSSLAPEAPVVSALPSSLGRRTGRGAPSLLASPRPFARPSSGLPSPISLPSRGSAPAVCQADAGGPARQSG